MKTILRLSNSEISSKNGGKFINSDFNLLIDVLNESLDNNQLVSIKPVYKKNATLLDLMRDKTISLESGNMLIKYLNKNEQGLLLCGGIGSGKTRWISALSSVTKNSRVPRYNWDPD